MIEALKKLFSGESESSNDKMIAESDMVLAKLKNLKERLDRKEISKEPTKRVRYE